MYSEGRDLLPVREDVAQYTIAAGANFQQAVQVATVMGTRASSLPLSPESRALGKSCDSPNLVCVRVRVGTDTENLCRLSAAQRRCTSGQVKGAKAKGKKGKDTGSKGKNDTGEATELRRQMILTLLARVRDVASGDTRRPSAGIRIRTKEVNFWP